MLFRLIAPINIRFRSDIIKVLLTIRISQILISDNTKSGGKLTREKLQNRGILPLVRGIPRSRVESNCINRNKQCYSNS